MKISILSNSKWRREHSRFTSRLSPSPPPLLPPVSSAKREPEIEIVDLRDRAKQKKLCGDTQPFRTTSAEPWRRVILGVLVAAALFVLALFLL